MQSLKSKVCLQHERCYRSGRQIVSPRILKHVQASASPVEDLKRTASKWAEEQQLDKKLQEASKAAESTFKNVVEQATETAQRTYRNLDNEYNISEKASTAGRKVEDTLDDIDQQWKVRRKLRNFGEYVQKNWPRWQAAATEFLETPTGKVTAIALLIILVQLPIFWRTLNFLLLLWWLSIPISLLIVGWAQQQQAQRMAEAQAEEARRRANPFADLSGMFRNAAAGGKGSGGSSGSKGRSSRGADGPIIDAEFTEIK